MNQAYEKYDKNEGGLIVLCIYGSGTDNSAKSFNKLKNIIYPTVSGSGGGSNVDNKYFLVVTSSTPCYVLVDPDKKVVEKNVYPTGNVLLSMLNKYDIQGTGITYEKKQQPGEKGDLSGMSIWRNNRDNALQISVPEAGIYTFKAFYVNGKEVGFIGNTFFNKGTHQILFNFRSCSQSVTLFEVQCGNRKIVKKIVAVQ